MVPFWGAWPSGRFQKGEWAGPRDALTNGQLSMGSIQQEYKIENESLKTWASSYRYTNIEFVCNKKIFLLNTISVLLTEEIISADVQRHILYTDISCSYRVHRVNHLVLLKPDLLVQIHLRGRQASCAKALTFSITMDFEKQYCYSFKHQARRVPAVLYSRSWL